MFARGFSLGRLYRKKRSDLKVRDKVAEFDRESISFSRELGVWSDVGVLELTDGE